MENGLSIGEMAGSPWVEKASIETPLGLLHIYARGRCILAAEFAGRDRAIHGLRRYLPHFAVEESVEPEELRCPFARYFDGDIHALAAVSVAPYGTKFQKRVWALLMTVPAGSTVSYGELAAKLGQPKAARAVGHANGCNPIPIIIPCHRVLGSDGSLTGYGSGLDRKSRLLRHEGAAFGRLL